MINYLQVTIDDGRSGDTWIPASFKPSLLLMFHVPNVPEHGVKTIQVPWAEPNSGFTALFEALVIDWLKEATTSAVAQQMKLSWSAIDGIQQRAVARGLARRVHDDPKRLAVDETSFQKRHEYVTVVTDHEKGVLCYMWLTIINLTVLTSTLKP